MYFKEDSSGEFELTTTVVNMNDSNNPIRSKCSILNDYMLLIEKIRMYNKSVLLNDAVDKAIDECIKEGVLTDVLLEFKAEVQKMCITEFDEKVYTEGIRSEGVEQERMRTVNKLLEKGMKPEEISNLLEYDKDFVIYCQANMKANK